MYMEQNHCWINVPLVHRSVLATGLVSPAVQVRKVNSHQWERKLGLKKITLHSMTAACISLLSVRKDNHSLISFFFLILFSWILPCLITFWKLFRFNILEYLISNENLCKMQNTVILTESCGILSGWLQINMHFWLHKHTASKKPFLCYHLWRGTAAHQQF